MDEKHRYERGLTVRREVLGTTYVDQTLSNRNSFNSDFQEMLTRHVWGEVWDRPGLSRHSRSLITIALLVALHHEKELRLHLNASKDNGVTLDEIKELLLHCSAYCGVPAANSAFQIASEVFSADIRDSHSGDLP